MLVKFTHDQHRAVIKLVLAVHLMADIHSHAAPPDFALLERERTLRGCKEISVKVPHVYVYFVATVCILFAGVFLGLRVNYLKTRQTLREVRRLEASIKELADQRHHVPIL